MKKLFLNNETGAIIIAPFNSTNYDNGHTVLGNGSRLECLSIIRDYWATNGHTEEMQMFLEEEENVRVI